MVMQETILKKKNPFLPSSSNCTLPSSISLSSIWVISDPFLPSSSCLSCNNPCLLSSTSILNQSLPSSTSIAAQYISCLRLAGNLAEPASFEDFIPDGDDNLPIVRDVEED
ncbi:hypothetical protein K1719_023937 [Acacia pycnantha]|nr:hypothetical protein K1719_023937 [Acacia pycnantha]